MKKISVRETSAKLIIYDLIKKDVPVLLDPTLLLNKEEWIQALELKNNNKKYIFAYFLNEPSEVAKNAINYLKNEKNLSVYYMNGKEKQKNNLYGGPIEFLNYLLNAEYVLTDSFHGLAFSINFNKNFYVFDRSYLVDNQSTRLKSLLEKVDLENRFITTNIEKIVNNDINYNKVKKIIEEERKKSIEYLKDNLKVS